MIALPEFDPVATSEDWVDTIELTDIDTDGPVDFTGFSFALEARLLTPNGVDCAVVSGSSAGGQITFPNGLTGGVMNLTFRTPFANQVGGRYRVLITATNGTDTILMVSQIPVMNLIVSPA